MKLSEKIQEALREQQEINLSDPAVQKRLAAQWGYVPAGAQLAPNAVAYLDLGVGGYMDIGTDLTDEALAALPKGRHMLGIVGMYGIEGYVPAQPAPTIAEQDQINAEAAIRSIYGARPNDEALWQTIVNGMITPAHIAQAIADGTITPAYIMQPAPSVPREAIEKMLTQLMDLAASNGASSVSMPDEYVEVAAWLCGIPAQPAPSVQDVPSKSLKPVIDWLRNGCDPMKAADELEILIAAAPEIKP